MRTVAYLVVLLIGAVVIIYVVGRSLPVTHVASRGERFDAPPDAVWAVVTDVAAYPSWRTDISSVELLPSVDGRPAWREVSGRDRIEYRAEELTAPELFVTRITTQGLPYGGSWRYELA
ncbi:MAG TPA: SRPBCC family protein, partial [Gemmatimonadaceae bacterium]|nr:SRPBCC family protein [Gemmatimonadaceae bacterium]